MNTRTCRRTLLMVTLVVLLNVPVASATLIVNLDSVIPFGLNYTFLYSVTIPAGELVRENGQSFFTIYDFPGLVTVSSPANWRAGSQFLGDTPAGLTPTDDLAIKNVTFEYDPSGGLGGPSGDTLGPATFTGFITRSLYGNVATGQYSWQNLRIFAETGGVLAQRNLSQTSIPTSGASSVPEPSSMILVGTGLIALAGAIKKKSLCQAIHDAAGAVVRNDR